MKQLFTTHLLALSFIFAACENGPHPKTTVLPDSPENTQHCDCPYLQPAYAHLQPNTRVITETTNSSQQQVREWREVQLELGLDVNKPLEKGNIGLVRLNGKAIIPYFNDGKEKYYQVVTVGNGQLDAFQKYMLLVCELYHRHYVLNGCKPADADKKAFLEEERALKKRLLGWVESGKEKLSANKTSATPPKAIPPSETEILLMHPGSIAYPTAKVIPEPVGCVPGAYSTALTLTPGKYTAVLIDPETGAQWQASFNTSEKIVPQQRFQSLNK